MRKPKEILILSFFLSFFMILSPSLWGTIYYVDATHGSDSNSGTSSSTAWRTIAKINNSMAIFQPGDSILFERGENWSDTSLYIDRSGTAGNPLIFDAYGTGNKPIVSGGRCIYSDSLIHDVTVRNFHVTNSTGSSIYFSGGSGFRYRIKVEYCDVEYAGNCGIYFDQTDTFTVDHCNVSYPANAGIVFYGSANYKATNGKITNCTTIDDSSASNDGITIHTNGERVEIGSNFLIENCVSHGWSENGLDADTGTNIIVRNCEVYNNGIGKGLAEISYGHVTRAYFENCYFHDSNDETFYFSGTSNQVVVAKTIVKNSRGRFWTMCGNSQYGYLANNTFIYDTDSSARFIDASNDEGTSNYLRGKNNIFTSTQSPGSFGRYLSCTPSSTNSMFNYNCWWDYTGNSGGAYFSDASLGSYNFATWRSTYNQDNNGFFQNPSLNSAQTLQSSSPCINAGGWLTTITSASGSGTSFAVADGKWFHNGFGLTSGSVIQLQSQSTPLTVTNINYGTNTITVNQSVSWAQGDGVAFAYSGYAPDIGAREYTGSQPLAANASGSPTSGNAPLAVNFTGSASGGTSPYSYRWTFGDGGSSTSQNPSHTYSSAGSYTATLTVTDSQSVADTESVNITVTAAPSQLVASASASPMSGQAPLTVNFTGSATGGTTPYTYSWNFGDGQTSSAQNPSHTYSSAGTYNAALTVRDSRSVTDTESVNITVTAAPSQLVASASASPTSGQAPLTVNFTGSATGGTSPYSYRWTFGDGGSSTSQNPSHTYSSAGSYTATLTVTDSQSVADTESVNITVTAAPSQLVASASASPMSGQAPLTVNFTGSATGGTTPYTYSWNFGDGQTSSAQNPSHTYSSAGTYNAVLTVRDSRSVADTESVNITVTAAPSQLVASASASPMSGQAPLTVNFTGSATGGTTPYTYSWNFGDGQTSSAQNPSHTYSSAGTYNAVLTVRDSRSVTDTESVNITVTAAPSQLVASASASPMSGQAPLTVNFTGSATGGTTPYTYSWNFGDGQTSSAQNPSHTYSTIGNYIANLTVTDSSSANASASISIAVGSVTGANLALAAVTGAPAPGQGGTTDPSPGNHSFSIGSTASVRSIPNSDYRFSKWTGDVTEAATFNTANTLTMDANKSLSATFCTKCADVNGDLRITPADAQRAFDIYLGRIANPTWCELENADVKCDGTKFAPKVTPSDAQTIFHKYLRKAVVSSDCSGNSRVAALATQSSGFSNVSLTVNSVTFAPGQDVVIPIIVESPSDIKAFGFDLSYPSDILTYVGLESTELTNDFDQLGANVLANQEINQERPKTDPAKNFVFGFDPSFAAKILTLQAINNSRPSQEFDQPSTGTGSYRLLRVGGYKTESTANPTSGVLVTLIFRVIGEVKDPGSISVIATYDDIKNASIKNDGMINRKNSSQIRKDERLAGNVERKLTGKRYDF